jgi:hypothetical protein
MTARPAPTLTVIQSRAVAHKTMCEARAIVKDGRGARGSRQLRAKVELEAGAGGRRAVRAWEKQVLSARGFKRVGRHSKYAI